MHGRNLASETSGREPFAPRGRFSPGCGSMRWCASAVISVSVEARPSMRPFTLRQRLRILRFPTAAGSTLLAFIFEAIPKPTPGPFGLLTPAPAQLFLPYGTRSPRGTRCQVRPRNFAAAAGFPLPSRTSRSFGILAPDPAPATKACLCGLPDLPSLPTAPEIISYSKAPRIIVPDPLLPARLAVLRTSWNHPHHVPTRPPGQYENPVSNRIPSKIILRGLRQLHRTGCV